MTVPKPEWVKGAYGVYYEDIVRSWPHEVISFDTTGSYQGDHEALLRDSEGRFGITVFGYGSCSGCDHLEAIAPWGEDGDWADVVKYSDQLADSVTWFDTPDAAIAWIDEKSKPDGNDWWAYDEEVSRVFAGYRTEIEAAS